MILLLSALLFLGPQQGNSDDFAPFLEKLRSDSISERAEAFSALKKAGMKALPAIEKAARSNDAESASRARRLADLIRVADVLGPDLVQAVPGIEERLAGAADHAWTEEFSKLMEGADPGGPFAAISKADWDRLAARALKGAGNVEEKQAVCHQIALRGLRSAAPAVASLLGDPEGPVRQSALSTLVELQAREFAPQITPLLRDKEAYVRVYAARAVGLLEHRRAVPQLRPLLEDPSPEVRVMTVFALGQVGGVDDVPRIRKLLKDEGPAVRQAAALTLARLRAGDSAGDLQGLLADPVAEVRVAAIEALSSLGIRDAVPGISARLADSEVVVRRSALTGLGDLGAAESAPKILALLNDPDQDLRHSAASWLCRLGDKRGAEPLLREGRDLLPLNALRFPREMKALGEKRVRGKFRGTAPELLDRLATEGGWKWVPPESPAATDRAWRTQILKCDFGWEGISLFDALRTALDPAGPYEALVEADGVRLVGRPDALTFWTQRLAKEKGADR